MEAERRQVTVLFTDMVGFTSFSERFGEEPAFALMQSLAKLMEDAVRNQGGVVQGFTGDGIMAVFGAPVAFEDAPLRACRAALAILKALADAGGDLAAKYGVRPQLRIGVNSGPAVVGKVQAGADAAVTVLGDTVNFAARLQGIAEPGTAILSEATHALVRGLVETSFVGEHQIKGKAEPQRAYRLDAIRSGATRFDAKLQRGLTTYVGRKRELERLDHALNAIGSDVQVFDIAGEPGIGKSRLVHEFLTQIVKDRARVLLGSCTPDGQQTPFRAFIEIVRGVFLLASGDAAIAVARKLEDGLQALGLNSTENLSLLLNLLGMRTPGGALEGLDGVLIGLRTRDLLSQLVRTRGRLTPTVLVFEDLHWLDSVSEDLLAQIVGIEEPLRLLILHTRRPEYRPAWVGQPHVIPVMMEPLSSRETSRIASGRLGVDKLPDALAKLIAVKADGNPLFAEEIASYLAERGIVRSNSAELVEFDPVAVAAALPESVQMLLASRVDRLAPDDRFLLQAASVIGRRFDPDLAWVVGRTGENATAAFAAMEALDLIRPVEGSADYEFKHALVRDALYNGLLSGPRAALHLKVAEELERRGGNRLTEIAETLAYHYTATSRGDKAFVYLAMAGDKSLDVYAIPEAEGNYRQALALFETQRTIAERRCVLPVIIRLLETLLLKSDYREIGLVSERYLPFIKEAGETAELTLAYWYQATSLFQRLEMRAALDITNEALLIAERLDLSRSKAYNRQGLVQYRGTLGLDSSELSDALKAVSLEEALSTEDNFIINWCYFSIAWDYANRGLYKDAKSNATQLIMSGKERNDPRAIALANLILAWTNALADAPDTAMLHADECVKTAITPIDRLLGAYAKAISRILQGSPQQGLAELDAADAELERLGFLYAIQPGPRGAALAMLGQLSQGIQVLKRQIARCKTTGDQTGAAWACIILAEIYIQIVSGKEKPSISLLLANLRTIVGAIAFGAGRARALLMEAAAFPMLSERGVIVARINFDLGVLSALKRKRAEARVYFEKARFAAEEQDADRLLQRIDAALTQLGD